MSDATEFAEERQERQTEDGEVVPFDRLEETDAEALELIAADGGEDRIADAGAIVVEEGVGEGAHGHRRDRDVTPDDPAVLDEGKRGMEFVTPAPQAFELGATGLAALGFDEAFAVEPERLIAAEHEIAGAAGRDVQRLRLGEVERDGAGVGAGGEERFLDGALVDVRGLGGEGETGPLEERDAGTTAGGEDERPLGRGIALRAAISRDDGCAGD